MSDAISQVTELEKVKDKIRKMMERTIDRGCSESEANSAMTKVGELLDQYNLTMDEVSVQVQKCVTKFIDTGSPNRNQIVVALNAIAHFCGTKMWTKRPYRSRAPKGFKTSRRTPLKNVEYGVFGFEPDVDMTIYLFNVINTALTTEVAKFKQTSAYLYADPLTYRSDLKGTRKHATNAFTKGFTTRIWNRLWEMKKAREEEVRKATEATQAEMASRMVSATTEAQVRASSSTALVLVAKEERIEKEFKETGIKLKDAPNKKVKMLSNYNYAAREAGYNAGENVNLSRPLSNGSANVSGYIGKDE